MNYEIKEYSKEYEKELTELLMRICVNEYKMKEYEKPLKQYVKKKEFKKAWIVLNDERIIATIGYEEKSKDIAEIKKVYIDKDYRHQGLGRKMMDYAVQYIKDNDYHTIYVGTSDNFSNAINFYQRYGFTDFVSDENGYVFEMQIK